MSVPTGQTSLLDIQNVFCGTNPISLNEYYNVSGNSAFNVIGIPASGQIDINSFRGKIKFTWPPIALQTNYNTYPITISVGSTNFEWNQGASGSNLTISGGSTFNNLGSDNKANRASFINYQNLILQARPGDTIQFTVQNTGAGPQVQAVYLNLGAGYFLVGSQSGTGSFTYTVNYIIPSSQSLGNYGILVYNFYSSLGYTSFASANFYSLHIIWPPPSIQTNYSTYPLTIGVGVTYYEWNQGASGSNLTRGGGSTFNNLGSDNTQNRANFINYQNLILQARPGDTIQIAVRNTTIYSDPEVQAVYLNLGAGYFLVGSQYGTSSFTYTVNYTIPSSQLFGSYGILVYNFYSSLGDTSFASANFYSLHIC